MCVLGIYVCYMVASLRGTKRERVESERQRERKGCVCVCVWDGTGEVVILVP